MKNTENYFEYTMNDIVFEGRNKKYGAYVLRKSSDRFISTGLVVTLFIVTALTVFFLTKKVVKPMTERIIVLHPLESIIFDIDPPVIPNKIIESTPPVKTETIKKVEVKVVDDDLVTTEILPPTIEELKGKTIGAHTDSSGVKGVEGPGIKNAGSSNQFYIEGKKKSDYVMYADVMPGFIGGYEMMNDWLRKNIRYPRAAIEATREGKVYIEFIVNEDGSISDAVIIKGIGFGCEEEALKAVQKMPKWKPGKQQGNPVRVKLTIPVDFRLG
ncbi:MAG: energy transducer TonB [Chitinophagales bacterium]|nr:energy transducer TonB [Chitinophagales bacterium]